MIVSIGLALILKLYSIMYIYMIDFYDMFFSNSLQYLRVCIFQHYKHKIFLKQTLSSNNYTASNFYFKRISRQWNTLPTIDLNQSLATIKAKICNIHLRQHFTFHFTLDNPCIYLSFCKFCRCSNCYNLRLSLSTLAYN